MPTIIKVIFLITVYLAGSTTMAQVDPSSVLLLKKGATNDDYSSSRYTVKPKDSKDVPRESTKTEVERKPQVHPLPVKPTSTQSGSNTSQPSNIRPNDVRPNDISLNDISPNDKKSAEIKSYEVTNDVNSEGLVSGVEQILNPDVFMGIEEVEVLKKHFHPQDRRKNIIEFSLGINYFYQNSNSRYWHRNYFSHGPGVDTNLNLWMTPFLGVHAAYSTSLNSDLRASPSGLEYLDADHTWFSSGLRFRKFFGLSRKAKSLNFGLDYYEYQLQIPTSSVDRMGLRSKGVSISLEIDVPETVSTSWQVGFELQPDLSHSELSGSRNIKSGKSNNSSSIGLWYGKKLWLNRKNQFYWKLSHRAETNKYSGRSLVEDPRLGEFIRGVNVNNSTSFFQMGFTWGR